jgi:hypothetical protein
MTLSLLKYYPASSFIEYLFTGSHALHRYKISPYLVRDLKKIVSEKLEKYPDEKLGYDPDEKKKEILGSVSTKSYRTGIGSTIGFNVTASTSTTNWGKDKGGYERSGFILRFGENSNYKVNFLFSLEDNLKLTDIAFLRFGSRHGNDWKPLWRKEETLDDWG